MKKGMALLLTSLCAGAMVVALSPNEAEAAHRRIITDAPKVVAAKETTSAEVKQESKAEESSEKKQETTAPAKEEQAESVQKKIEIRATDYLCFQSQTYTYGEFQKDIDSLQKSLKTAVRVDELGQTVDGNKLYDIRVGNPNAKHHLLVFGGIHAREYMTSQLVMRQLVQLLSDQGASATFEGVELSKLLETTEVHIIPMANPDGISISQSGLGGVHSEAVKKQISQIAKADKKKLSASYLQQWKSNANGVDLNRNFDALWENYQDHLGHRSADHYKGTAPESEIESKALADLTRKVKFDATISYHTQGQVIYWNFGQKGALKDMTLNFANKARQRTGYRIDGNFQSLDTAGYKDWAIMKMGIPSLTIEVGSGGNPVSPSQMEAVWNQNKEIVPMTLKMIADGQLHQVQ
ncbi:MAG: peptidase [Lachnospiraceae bacterium]|jgi:hypothetical protein|nr:peptidase [Lachnospiraceae bacterium]